MQVTPAVPVRAGAPMTVRVAYTGVPSAIPSRHCGASPWLRTADGAVAVGEPDIAPWWYPCNDHPTDKASFTITAVVPADLQAISNGALLGGPEPVEPGWQRWRWQQSEPMATYLAFVAIGHYDIVRRDTVFGPYLAAYDRRLPPAVATAARASVEQTPQIIEFLSTIFGPYPFRQLGGVVPDTPALGSSSESQTHPLYASEQFTSGERVTSVVHELAHPGPSFAIVAPRRVFGSHVGAEWPATGGPFVDATEQAVIRAGFTNRHGKPLHPGFLTHRWAALVAGAGLSPIRLHDLRHGGARLAHLAAGTI